MRVLGLSAFHRDSAAAVCVDGELLAAAQEERFSRVRADSGLPRRAARWCLERAGLRSTDLEAVVFYERPLRKFERTLAVQLQGFPRSARSFSRGLFLWLGDRLWLRTQLAEEFGVEPAKVQFVEHARSHAALAFYSSPFPRAAVLVVDDLGEWASTTLARGENGTLATLAELHHPHSLGLWFSAYTQFLGFEPGHDEEQVEALAHRGAPRWEREVADTVPALVGGAFEVDTRLFRFAHDAERLFDPALEQRFGPARQAGGVLRESAGDSRNADLAASVQRVLEERVLALARELHARTGLDALCLGGEVLRNRTLVARLAQDGPFRELYAPTALGEAGAAAGAALEHSQSRGVARRAQRPCLALGESPDPAAWENAGSRGTALGGSDAAPRRLAERLRAGHALAWVRGRVELGRESLGARLVLCAASNAGARERLLGALGRADGLALVRVLAREEEAELWFDLPRGARELARHALCTARASAALRAAAPSAVLADGVVWPQLVVREWDRALHALLGELGRDGQAPLALAASLQLRGQPIASSSADVLDAFARSTLDALALDDLLIEAEVVPSA
jgi:carbamoyltransferase